MREIITNKVTLTNGETIFYRETKTGQKPLLLIHGNNNSSVNWDLLMENISDDYKVYALDLRGFGESTYQTPITSINDFSDDIKLFVDSLNICSFVLSGWSLGGAVVMRFTLDYPQYVEKLILLASSNIKGFPVRKRNIFGRPKKEFIQSKKEMEKLVRPLEKVKARNNRWILKKLLNSTLYSNKQPDSKRYDEYLDAMIKQRNLADVNYALMTFNISDSNNGVVDGTNEAKNINVPTLIIQGKEDKVVHPKFADEIKHAIGENAEIKILEGCGHSPLLDDLENLTKVYEQFINFNKDNSSTKQ